MAQPVLGRILERVETPLVVMNHRQEILLANHRGEVLCEAFLRYLPTLETGSRITSQISDFFGGDSPITLEWDNKRVRLTPLSAEDHPQWFAGSDDGGLLIEWLPVDIENELHILREVTEAVNSSLILEDIFEALGDVLQKYIPYRETTIVILDDSQNGIKILVRMFQDGSLDISGENNAFAGYDALVDSVLQRAEPMIYDEKSIPESVVLLPQTRSLLVVPLVNKGVVIGLMAMAEETLGAFDEYHQKLVLEVSKQVAVAVENAKLYWQTQAQASREFLINQLTSAIRRSLEIEDILNTAVNELGKVTGISRCYIQYFPGGMRDEEVDPENPPQLYQYAMHGVPQFEESLILSTALEHNVYRKRIRGLQEAAQKETGNAGEQRLQEAFNPFILNDVRDCPPFFAEHRFFKQHRILSLAVFPILIGDQLVGAITLHQCDTYRVWVYEDIALMKAIAEHVGVALYQARLFRELESRKQTLEKTLQELQQAQIHLVQSEKMAMLGQFVAGIAHEVNTPLGTMTSNNDTITGCVEKLNQNMDDMAQRQKLLSAIENLLSVNRMASERIQEIVRNLRNFARLDESELKTVSLQESLDSTLLLLSNAMQKARVRLEIDFPEDFPHVECFPGLLNQVLMNMLVNALHAVDGRKDSCIRVAGSVLPATEESAPRVHISITDNGKGIAPDHLSRIFDPGFTTKGVGVGTGLGLALCFKIVEKHQGRILVESTEGVGTTMTVEIPVRQHLH